MKLYIKNMLCLRCITGDEGVLQSLKAVPVYIQQLTPKMNINHITNEK